MRKTLTSAREEKGWSVEELARKCGIHFSTLYRLENGQTVPNYRTVKALEDALGAKPGTLEFPAMQVSA